MGVQPPKTDEMTRAPTHLQDLLCGNKFISLIVAACDFMN